MKVGPYAVEEVLGRGGMGTVHRGVHRVLGASVALKELTHPDPGARAMMLEEARLLFGLKHPSFPTVLDLLEERGRTWLVMDFIAGPTLTHVATGRPLRADEALLLGRGLCGALAFLHARGVLHRDIKPDNILLPRGLADPVLVDLGIASRVGQGSDGSCTPGMAPPEQERGQPCTPSSDVYQVAATLLWSTTGYAPPPASQRRSDADLGPAGPALAALPQAFREAVTQALSLEPRHRPGTSHAFQGPLPPASLARLPDAQPSVQAFRPRLDIRR